jgi:GPN-loop GTPase 3 homolog UM01243
LYVIAHNDGLLTQNKVEDYSMVSFLPLDLSNEESLNLILSCIDNILQYGEDEEPIEPKDIEHEESDLT